jgi:nuclease-like protein
VTALALVLAVILQQAPCRAGEVTSVDRGRDYTVTICGVGTLALRGVEPPLGTATGLRPTQLQERITEFNLPVSGEILGQTDLGPDGIQLVQQLVTGRRVTIIEDGWRQGDPPGRRYAYVFLPDKRLVNLELIKRGYGYADRLGSHPRRDEFIAVEDGARRQKLGVWAQ